jgi:hypothetical protein
MSTSTSIELNIANALPQANAADSVRIVELWRQIGQHFRNRSFAAQSRPGARVKLYNLSLDASGLVQTMEQAVQQAGSFDKQRAAHIEDRNARVAGSLLLTIADRTGEMQEREIYEVATLFLQQLVIAANLVLPGSCQILAAAYTGPGAHLVEAGVADSVIFGGARRVLQDAWQLPAIGFDQVWSWIETLELSHTHTAIKAINKVLLTQLKVAEQRHEYSARTVLLVLFQLEMLLDCHTRNDASLLRKRLRLLLGDIPERIDCIKDLFVVRSELLQGHQPVMRPPLLAHDMQEELEDLLGQHNMTVINAAALVQALLAQLISKGGSDFVFSESASIQ